MTALQVLKNLKKEKWPELKTGEYNLPLILAAMHKFAELRQCNVSGQSEQLVCDENELDCPYEFTSRCTMGRCDCKPKQTNCH